LWATLILVLVGALFFFHIFLAYSGKTTQEFLRGVDTIQHTENVIQHSADRYFLCGVFRVDLYHTLLLPMWEEEVVVEVVIAEHDTLSDVEEFEISSTLPGPMFSHEFLDSVKLVHTGGDQEVSFEL
jgi:hypothetical protein